MKPELDNFIVGVTTTFWASIYQKRKMARSRDMDYDLAAEINQLPGIRTFHEQDAAVKDIFRELVSYISEVKLIV